MTLISTLLTDGSSDVVLLPILRWLFGNLATYPVEVRWADLRGLRVPPSGPRERIERAVELYPCQLLLVHRDAEKPDSARDRFHEIEEANQTGVPHVCVVPIRMQEAWLLHDETALRRAAGRPSGTEQLGLPPARSWETLPDPKDVLHRALTVASGAKGRRAKQFKPQVAAHRLADLIEDWSPLRRLSAFQKLETDMLNALAALEHA